MSDVLAKQVKARPLLGGIQVQFSNIGLYLSLYNTVALTLTLWTTTIIGVAWWPRWITLPTYLGFALLGLLIVMYLDYKFVYSSRQAFINEQACKHPNPAMDSLNRIEAELATQKAELKAIRKKLGIKKVRK